MRQPNEKTKKANEYLFVSLCLIIVLFILFAPALFQGLVLVPAETSYHIDYIYQGLAEQVSDLPSNGLLSDLVYQMYPWRHFLDQSLAQGFVPLWNPYSLCGLPFLANDQSAIFEVTKLASYLLSLGPQDFFLFTSLVTLLLAGFFCYLFVRNLKLNWLASLASCLAFMLSGPLIVWLGYPLTSVVIWLPLILLAIDKLVAGQSKIWLLVLAMAIAAQFLAGNPEISWFILLLAAIYALWRLWPAVKKRCWSLVSQKTAWLILAVLLGLVLAAIQLLPAIEFIQQSDAYLVGRGGLAGHSFWQALITGQGNSWSSWQDFSDSFYQLPLLLFPDYFGNPVLKEYWGPSNYNESAMQIGLIALVFAWLGLAYLFKRNQHRSEVLFWLLAALITFGIIFNWPLLNLVGYLPIFKIVALGRLRFILVFSLAVLAGYGVHWLTQKNTLASAKKKLAYFNIVFFALAAYLRYRFIVDEVDLAVRTQQKIFIFFLWLAVNLGLVLILFGFNKTKRNLGYLLFLVVLVLELVSYSIWYHPAIESKLVFPKTKVIQYLQENLSQHRLTNWRQEDRQQTAALQPNSSLLWQMADVRGYEIVKPYRYESLERHFMEPDNWLSYKHYDQKLFNLLGIKYFIQGANQQENHFLDQQQSLKEVTNNGIIKIYQNLAVLPRAFVVFNIHPIDDFFLAKDVFFMETFRPDMTAIIETDQPEVLAQQYDNQQSKPLQAAKIVTYQPNKVIIETIADSAGFLVLTDVYDAGWRAWVDGQPEKIYPTDVSFRGLFVPAGQHKIVFEYLPSSYVLGKSLTLTGLFICGCWLILWVRQKIATKK